MSSDYPRKDEFLIRRYSQGVELKTKSWPGKWYNTPLPTVEEDPTFKAQTHRLKSLDYYVSIWGELHLTSLRISVTRIKVACKCGNQKVFIVKRSHVKARLLSKGPVWSVWKIVGWTDWWTGQSAAEFEKQSRWGAIPKEYHISVLSKRCWRPGNSSCRSLMV